MTHEEMSKFTNEELSYFSNCNLTMNKYDLLQKHWDAEIISQPSVEKKLSELCRPFAEKYEQKYHKKLAVREVLGTFDGLLQLLIHLPEVAEVYLPIAKELVRYLVSLFSQ